MSDWFYDTVIDRFAITRELFWAWKLRQLRRRVDLMKRRRLARLECQHRDLMGGG